jgi:hypothetical protein
MVDRPDGETLMDFANVMLTVILSGIALAAIIIRGVKYTMRAMLIEEGLIRPGKSGATMSHWPNGFRNLPDTLEGIHAEIQKHHGDDA